MGTILKREIGSYFTSPVAYIVMAVFFFYSGTFFVGYNFSGQTTNSLSPVFSNMMVIIIYLTPIISMKTFSDEKRLHTDQALLTSPVRLTEIVIGKYLGALFLYAVCCAIFPLYGLIISFFGKPDWAVIICTEFGIFLLGAALIAIDVFISSLTESQAIAAIVGIAVGIVSLNPGVITDVFKIDWLTNALNTISFTERCANFTFGMFDLRGVVFFLSVIVLFNFLTVRVLDRRRWS
jgi:ABC-2 type transport system permease protein